MSKPFGTYDYVPRVRKVKLVKFFIQECCYDGTIDIEAFERDINGFADDNPSFKILGVRIEAFKDSMIAVVTYLENAKNGQMTYDGDDDGSDEERDSD